MHFFNATVIWTGDREIRTHRPMDLRKLLVSSFHLGTVLANQPAIQARIGLMLLQVDAKYLFTTPLVWTGNTLVLTEGRAPRGIPVRPV
jgi:hypothetical protein